MELADLAVTAQTGWRITVEPPPGDSVQPFDRAFLERLAGALGLTILDIWVARDGRRVTALVRPAGGER